MISRGISDSQGKFNCMLSNVERNVRTKKYVFKMKIT